MIVATIPLSHFTALDAEMMGALMASHYDIAAHDQNCRLWQLCVDAMGLEWCCQFKTAPECAAMIVAMALLKQIEIVEDV